MADIKRRDAEDAIWQVLTSFGFSEEDSFTEKDRYFILDKREAAIVTGETEMARADAVAACIESAFAAGADDFSVQTGDKAVFDLLVLFGFENILELGGKTGFLLMSGGTVFAEGTFEERKTVARIDIDKLLKICKNADSGVQAVSKSVVFAEKNAEGVAYDLCYNLRVNGCIVEMYQKSGNIEAATKYATEENAAAVVRCFANGGIAIMDLSKGEVTETTISDFLGYYEDDCDHHQDCDCGHHHN